MCPSYSVSSRSSLYHSHNFSENNTQDYEDVANVAVDESSTDENFNRVVQLNVKGIGNDSGICVNSNFATSAKYH